MANYDQNDQPIYRDLKHEDDGTWGVNVWVGGGWGHAHNISRNFYKTKKQAQAGDKSDFPGKNGCVRTKDLHRG